MPSHDGENSPPLPPSEYEYVKTTARFSSLDRISSANPSVFDSLDALQNEPLQLSGNTDSTLSWKRYWTIPLYGFAFLAHRRYRAWQPRTIPSLTTIRLPELYGTLALGEFASIEARRLAKADVDDTPRTWVHMYSWVMKDMFTEYKADTNREFDFFDVSLLAMSSLSPKMLFQRYTRTWLSGNESRTFVSRNVSNYLVEEGATIHDGDVLITYVAEEIERQYSDDELDWSLGGFLPCQISDLVNRRPFQMNDALYLPLASFALLGIWRRMTAPWALSTLCLNGTQRLLFYVYAYRTLGAHYRHEASLDTFDYPDSVAEAAYRAYRNASGED